MPTTAKPDASQRAALLRLWHVLLEPKRQENAAVWHTAAEREEEARHAGAELSSR